ncbi:hypothetical protein MMC16_000979 [Acarospora aff. strigata]|nr:hypothetical protein [Acarospora aff. strigata]
MTDYTMQDIAAGCGDDDLTSQLENIPLLASPYPEDYSQTLANQPSPTNSNLLNELFGESREPTSYPSPNILPMTDPYLLTQPSQTPSQPAFHWPSPLDIGNFNDFLDPDLIDAWQIPLDTFPAINIANNGQVPFNSLPTQAGAPIVDPAFLLYGSQIPNPSRHYTPLPQREREPSADGNSSDPEDLALSPLETGAEKTFITSKTQGTDHTGAKHRLKPIIRGWGVDSQKPWIKTNLTKGKNTRAARIADYKPEDHYTALASAPPSWQGFSYTPFGELEAGRTYTVEQLRRYLFEHPLHHTPNGYDPKRSGLQIRIQKNPADSARRYPTYASSRCRFIDCYGKNRCINQGQYRVAFDEQTHRAANTDPQHNAGYVHLYCLEKHLDFPLICANLNVRVETRSLPREPDARNRMLLGRSAALPDVAQTFIDTCELGVLPPDYPRRDHGRWRHEGSLTHRLCLAKMEEDGPQRMKAIRARGEKGSVYTQHLGNLEVESVEREKTRRHLNQQAPKGTAGKRKRGAEESEEEAEDEAYTPRRKTRRTRARA